MSKAPIMPVFPDALIGDTTHLSAEEFGAYCLILFATWRNNGKPFPDDDHRLARVCRVSETRWRNRLRPALAGFFDLSQLSWRQQRLEKEWKKARKNIAQKTRAGNANALKRRHSALTAVIEPLVQPIPIPIKKEDSVPSELAAEPPPAADPIKEIWDRGLAVLGGQRSLLGKLRKNHGDEAVLAAIVACEREHPSEPAAFLIACLARVGPAGVSGRHPGTYRPSPAAALHEGGYLAAQNYIRRHNLDLGDGDEAALPLLDGRRPG